MLIDAIYSLIGGSDPVSVLQSVVFALVAIVVALTLHEFAHAAVASLCGDKTSKAQGRLSLNPLNHIDPVGFLMLFVFGFGWAKPVPVNPYNYKNYKKGSIWVAVAGVLANLILAFLFYPIIYLVNTYLYPLADSSALFIFARFLLYVALYGFMLDLSFFAFNLIPVYPLDGFRLADAFVKNKGAGYEKYKRVGYYVLLGLILFSSLCSYIPELKFLDVFGYFMNFCVKIIGYPISWFWDTIFGVNFRTVLWKIIA